MLPFGSHHFHREADPVVEIRLTLDRGGGFRRVGRQARPPALQERRVRHDVIEAAGNEPGRRSQKIAGKHRNAPRHPVRCDVVAGQPNQVAAAIRARRCGTAARGPPDTDSPHRCRSRYRARADAGSAGIAAARKTGSIAARAPSRGWLMRTRPPSSAILGRRLCRYRSAQRSSSSAAAMIARARG